MGGGGSLEGCGRGSGKRGEGREGGGGNKRGVVGGGMDGSGGGGGWEERLSGGGAEGWKAWGGGGVGVGWLCRVRGCEGLVRGSRVGRGEVGGIGGRREGGG